METRNVRLILWRQEHRGRMGTRIAMEKIVGGGNKGCGPTMYSAKNAQPFLRK